MALRSDIYQSLNQAFGRSSLPTVAVGDTVRVHQRVKEGAKTRIQIFEGLVIAKKHGQGLNGSFTVRKIATGGVGVERVFPLHLPSIVRVDRVKQARVRRAKLYYMRGRFGKGARFNKESALTESWEEELDKEVGEAAKTPAEEKKATDKAPAEVAPAEEKPAEDNATEAEPTAAAPAAPESTEEKSTEEKSTDEAPATAKDTKAATKAAKNEK